MIQLQCELSVVWWLGRKFGSLSACGQRDLDPDRQQKWMDRLGAKCLAEKWWFFTRGAILYMKYWADPSLFGTLKMVR